MAFRIGTGLALLLGFAALAACGPDTAQEDQSTAPPSEVAAEPEMPAQAADAPEEMAGESAEGVAEDMEDEELAISQSSSHTPDATSEGLHQATDEGEDLYRRGFYREAIEYWEVAADEGDAYAAYRLGVEYFDANVLERDMHYAILYYQRAAELGHAAAMFDLAGFYEAGIGVEPSIEQTAHFYLQSALRGFPPAQHNVATMFEAGEGVPQDLVRAYMFYELALRQGFRVNFADISEEGATYIDPRILLAQEMTDEEIALAVAEADAFEPIMDEQSRDSSE